MSYCRLSSDDFKCDVYVYANVSGYWTIHVAGRKLVGDEERPSGFGKEHFEWADRNYEKIELPCAQESFDATTPLECAEWLLALQDIGYSVPEYAIDGLIEDHKDE